tara:strand:+ start:562 stop:735 length:174 start_codon:yes stop_codon:yes gene_type:complete
VDGKKPMSSIWIIDMIISVVYVAGIYIKLIKPLYSMALQELQDNIVIQGVRINAKIK